METDERYIPSEEQYFAAFQAIYPGLTPGHRAILDKLYEHCYFMKDNRPVLTSELSASADYQGNSPGQIGIIGVKFCEFFELPSDVFGKPGLAIVNWFEQAENGYWYLELLPEAARAFKRYQALKSADHRVLN
jgi:hypothetical protein